MKYNFDEIIERRNTNAMNTDGFRSYIFHAGPEKTFAYKDEEFVRMWVADMEFATPPEICDAIKARVDKRIFGYSMVFDNGYYEALRRWCETRYDWSFPKEELVFSPGIIPALYQLAELLVEKDEKMLIVTPAYGYFQHTAEYNHIELVCSELHRDGGHFTIDFEDFAQKAARLAPCYFVTGNHEHRLEQEELKDFLSRLEQLGVTVLRNEAVTMGMGASSFRLLGVDCQQGRTDTVEKLMAGARPGQLQILLSHKPHYAENYARAGVDLVLCGHAHGGQFRLPVVGGLFAPGQGIVPKYTAGMYRLGEQTTMLVSRGLGNSSFPVRVGNPPQLCVVTLRHGE